MNRHSLLCSVLLPSIVLHPEIGQKAPNEYGSTTDFRVLLITVQDIFLISQLGFGVGLRQPLRQTPVLSQLPGSKQALDIQT